MKTTTLLLLFFTAFSVIAQEKLFTNSGIINFEASVPFFEEIKAVNRQVSISLDPKSNTFICTVIIKDFRFKLDMMQSHFNANYMESQRYPKAVFKGKIEKLDFKDIGETAIEYQIKGKIVLKGKSKEMTVKALIKKVSGGIQILSDFPIEVSDFDIRIPEEIAAKISKTAHTELTGVFKTEDSNYVTLK